MMATVETRDLGKRYRRHWALQHCSLDVPEGRVAALVGPNGAGKSTLLQMVAGLFAPTSGSIRVLGLDPARQTREVLPRIGFVAQDHPLYRRFSVRDMLTMGAKLNPHWDQDLAVSRLDRLNVPLRQKVGTLSGGQQAQVALVLALAKRPDVMVLDEPMASLDPLARREFLCTLMEVAAERGMTVLLSSHIIADLERVCDYLIVLSRGQIQLAGDIDDVVAQHRILVGDRQEVDAVTHNHNVIHESHTERQTTLLVKTNGQVWGTQWEVEKVTLEDVVLAYLGHPIVPAVRAPGAEPVGVQ